MKAKLIFGLFVACIVCNTKTYSQEVHILDTSKAYRSGYSAKIENVPGLDGNDKAIVIVNPQTTGYQHQVAAWFRQGFWWVSNTDQSPMQPGNYFEIQFYRNPTPAAFAHKATPQNLVNGKSRIDNPALDNRPNALFYVYQSFSNNNGGLITQYVATQEYNEAEKKWYLVNTGGQPISAGNSYAIVIINSGGVGGIEPLEKPAGLGSPKENVAKDLASKAGGDLSGNYPNPNVIGLQGRPLSNLQPKVGDTLTWDGTQWKPSSNTANQTTEPLKFNPTLGKKITLYPGQTGDVGLSVAGNLLQIHSDKPDADVAIGFDQSGTFNEKFRVKATGALAVSGDAGQPGQVLTSNGAGSAPTWQAPQLGAGSGVQGFSKQGAYSYSNLLKDGASLQLDQLAHTITLNRKSIVSVNLYFPIRGKECALCHEPQGRLDITINGSNITTHVFGTKQEMVTAVTISNQLFILDPGTYVISFTLFHQNGTAPFFPVTGYSKFSSILVFPTN